MSSIQRQGITNTLITYVGVLIGFISVLFIQPNLLNPEELGLTRILIAAASIIATILPLSVQSVTTNFFPFFRNEEKKHHGYFGFMLLFPLVGTLICGVLIYFFKDIIIKQYINQSFLFVRYFDLLLPFAFFIALNIVLNAYSSSLFKTTFVAFFEGVLVRLLFIVSIVVYYFGLIDLTQFVYAFVSIYMMQAVSVFLYIYKIDKLSFKIDIPHLKTVGISKIINFSLLFTLASFASLSLRHLDTVMIGKYMSFEYVGVFAVSAYIALIIEIPLTSLERITHFKVSQAWANNDVVSVKDIYYKSVKYLMLIGGLFLIGIVVNIKDLLHLLPTIYHQGVSVTIIASLGAFFNISSGVNTSVLFTSNKYKYGNYLLYVLFVMGIVLNVLLIPRYGLIGAVLATSISTLVYNVLKFIVIRKFFKMQPYNLASLKTLLIIVIVFLISYFLPSTNNIVFSIIYKSSCIGLLYLLLTYQLNIVPEFHKYIPFEKQD